MKTIDIRLPYIVGPFNKMDISIFDQPPDKFQVTPEEIKNISQIIEPIKFNLRKSN